MTMSSGDVIPPIAPVRDHLRHHHGDAIQDPYEWLRDTDDPAARAYLDAENDYADALTAHLQSLRDRIFHEIKSRVLETDVSVPVADGPWWYYARTVEGQQYPLHARAPIVDRAARPDLTGEVPGEQILVDGNLLAGDSEFFSLGALTVSEDHGTLAYAVDLTGDERFDVTVVDLATGAVIDDSVRDIGYGVEFDAAADYLFYTRLDDAWRPHELWRHRLGSPVHDDVLLHTESDERFWMGLGGSRDQRWVMMALGSKTTSEVWLLPADAPLAEFRCVSARREGVEYDVEVSRDGLFIVHNRDQRDADLAWAPLTSESDADWVPLLVAAPGERFLGVDVFDAAAVLSLRSNGMTALRVIPIGSGDGADRFGPPRDLEVEEALYSIGLGDNPEPGQTSVQIVVESFVTPRTVLDVDLQTNARTVLKQQPVLGDFDSADYQQHRVWATTQDGTQVPVSVVARADVVPDGSAPGLLTAYGAYEISSDPYFSVARLSLLDRGVVYAVAHVRGGGEMGRHWYDEGKLLAKPNSFSDTVSARDSLVSSGWVDPARVALEGGSAGGLLVGAVANLAPDKFAVVHASVPFVDALTTILMPEMPLTIGEWEEWGNPLADPEVYAVMKSYSPYENIVEREYPAILATTSLHDTRVSVTEPAKWVARLRATVTADPVRRPILLRTEMAAGHGGRSGRYAAWEQIAWEWAFVLDRLGLA